jgi:hypothetical protein
MFGTFFGISSTPITLSNASVKRNEFSLLIIEKQSILHCFNMKNTITYDRKGSPPRFGNISCQMFGTFFGISSTPMQPVTCNEFSLLIIVKQSILHWFNMKNIITCNRKGLHHELEIFHARCLGRFLVFLQHQSNLSHVMSFLF